MMPERRSRWVLGGATGVLWGATIGTAMSGIQLKLFLAIWLATLLASLWSIAVWLVRGDHARLARVRTQIEAARLKGALVEEAEARTEQSRMKRRVRSVA